MGNTSPEERFLATYDTYADAVFRLCLVKTSNREAALDLTQETFMKVWDYLVAGHEIENMRGFTFAVAHNLIKDHYKKKRPLYEHELLGDMPDRADEESMTPEWAAEAGRTLTLVQALSDEHQEVLLLRYVEGMSVKDIAALLEERENTVSVRLNRALKHLREVFEGGN